jgi:hypothetical protein
MKTNECNNNLSPKGAFGEALRTNSLLNPAGALSNSFSERSDSMMIL